MRPREGADSAEGHTEGTWWGQDGKSSLGRFPTGLERGSRSARAENSLSFLPVMSRGTLWGMVGAMICDKPHKCFAYMFKRHTAIRRFIPPPPRDFSAVDIKHSYTYQWFFRVWASGFIQPQVKKEEEKGFWHEASCWAPEQSPSACEQR